jgi:hypothetical protein
MTLCQRGRGLIKISGQPAEALRTFELGIHRVVIVNSSIQLIGEGAGCDGANSHHRY